MKYSNDSNKRHIQYLNQRVLSIQKGEENIDNLIQEFKPFIKSAAAKATGRHIDEQNDEMSIALLAFDEAVQHYNAQKGSFLAFSSLVISRRLTDYMRKQGRLNKEIIYSELSESQKNYFDNQYEESVGFENPLIMEIKALDAELKKYNIAFEELVFASPKALKTKESTKRIIKYMASDIEKVEEMRKNIQLPVKQICEKCDVPRKLIERHRKYIVAVIEILVGDYPYLQDYISYAKEVKNEISSC